MTNIYTYYQMLGLEKTASSTEIKETYRNLVKKWHPDRFINEPEKIAQAKQEIQRINEAYENIKNYLESPEKFTHNFNFKSKKSAPNVHYDLGVQLAEQEDYQAAIAEFSQTIKLDNKYIKAYQYRGFIFSKLGYEHRAEADFKKVAEIEKKNQNKSCSEQKTKQSKSYHASKHDTKNHNQWRCIRILSHKQAVSSILLSSDNRLLITGSYDNSIRIWELKTGQLISILQGHSKAITCLTISQDNNILISGSRDKTIRCWDIKKQKVIRTFGGYFSGHLKELISLALDKDNKTLISCGADNMIKIWDFDKGKKIKEINCKSGQITSLALEQNQGYFCNSGLEKQLRIRSIETGKVIRSLRGSSGATSLAFSNDGNFLATGEMNRHIQIFDMASRKIIKTLTGHSDRISDLVFSNNNQKLISASWDNTIKLWDIENEIELETLSDHTDRILSLAITSDGKNLISGSRDCRIRIWQSILS